MKCSEQVATSLKYFVTSFNVSKNEAGRQDSCKFCSALVLLHASYGWKDPKPRRRRKKKGANTKCKLFKKVARLGNLGRESRDIGR